MCHLWYKQEEVTVGADQCNHSPLLLALSCRGLHRFENIYPTQKGTNICQDWTIGHFSLSDGHCVRLGNQRFRNSCHNRPDYTLDLFHMTDPRSLLHFSIFALMHKRVICSPGQWRHRAHHHIKTRLASVIWDIKYSCAIFCSGASNICC